LKPIRWNHFLKPPTLKRELWDDSLQSIIEDMDGHPLNVHGLMANNPELLKAWWDFRNHSVHGGRLGRRLGELLILRVAVNTGAWYEWATHVVRGQEAGLSLDEIERVKQGGGADGWTPAEAVLLGGVDELHEQGRLTPATLAQLEPHFDKAQLMDLMAITGMYAILASMINTWGLEVDESIKEQLPEGQTEQSFLDSLEPE